MVQLQIDKKNFIAQISGTQRRGFEEDQGDCQGGPQD